MSRKKWSWTPSLVCTTKSRPYRDMYFTDRGIEELAERRGEETVSLAWLADRLRDFVDENPDFEVPVERLATWLARDDEDADDIDG